MPATALTKVSPTPEDPHVHIGRPTKLPETTYAKNKAGEPYQRSKGATTYTKATKDRKELLDIKHKEQPQKRLVR